MTKTTKTVKRHRYTIKSETQLMIGSSVTYEVRLASSPREAAEKWRERHSPSHEIKREKTQNGALACFYVLGTDTWLEVF